MHGQTTLLGVGGRRLPAGAARSRRQQQVMAAMARRFKELDWLPRLPGLWLAFGDLTEIDLSLPEIHWTGLAGHRTAARAGAWADVRPHPDLPARYPGGGAGGTIDGTRIPGGAEEHCLRGLEASGTQRYTWTRCALSRVSELSGNGAA
jgi:hypothetical protein